MIPGGGHANLGFSNDKRAAGKIRREGNRRNISVSDRRSSLQAERQAGRQVVQRVCTCQLVGKGG